MVMLILIIVVIKMTKDSAMNLLPKKTKLSGHVSTPGPTLTMAIQTLSCIKDAFPKDEEVRLQLTLIYALLKIVKITQRLHKMPYILSI